MFVLRRINLELVEINTYLGSDYVVVLKERSNDSFNLTVSQWKPNDLVNVYGVVTFDYGESIVPLYEGSTYYVMTIDGKTFSNISEK